MNMTSNVSDLVKVIEELRTKTTDMWTWRIIIDAVADGRLTPAEQCFSVKEGCVVQAYERREVLTLSGSTKQGLCGCPLTEALTIRSAEEVRREALDRVEELLHEVAAGDLGVYEVIDTMRSIATDFPCSETKPSTEKMAIIDPAIIDLIGELGREVYYLLDDSEESGPIGDTAITVDKEQFDKVSAILDRIEALPYEEPGCILGVGAKLQAALKQAHDTPAPSTDTTPIVTEAALSEIRDAVSNGDLSQGVRLDIIDDIAASALAAQTGGE